MKASNQEMHPLHDVSPEDAIGMLIADHKRVAGLFADFKRLTEEGRDDEKAPVVEQICQELTVHTQLEEELFYPAVRKAIDDKDQVDEAVVEHAGAKQLIAQLLGAGPDDDLYDAKVVVLAEQIDHHVEEEEKSMFLKARYAGLDTVKLGAAMLARKAELMGGAAGRSPPPAAKLDRGDEEVDETDPDYQARPSNSRGRIQKKPARQKATASSKKSRR